MEKSRKKAKSPKRVLALPDLEQSKAAVLRGRPSGLVLTDYPETRNGCGRHGSSMDTVSLDYFGKCRRRSNPFRPHETI
jgi:hypothetical protein